MDDKRKRSSGNSRTRRVQSVSDETRMFKTDELSSGNTKRVPSRNTKTGPNRPKGKNVKRKKNKKQKPLWWRVVKRLLIIILILGILAGLIIAGIIAGLFLGLFGDDFKMTKDDLLISFSNSEVYDADGNLIATLSGNEKRKIISMDEMPEVLPKAYVAIEDERFFEHSGVDIKRTGAATVSYLLHRGSSSFGGSTITQQLVKNITKDDEDSATRKIKEMARAIQIEKEISKDNILELYLNVIFVGGNNINGVALGSEYYFNKNVKDLSVAECAFMAGINNSPNKYSPFSDYDDAKKKLIDNRTRTVLDKMYEFDYINKEQYDAAYKEVDEGLKFQQGNTGSSTIYSHHTEAAINEIINQLMEEKDMSRDMAETTVYGGGLKIYTAQRTSVQNAIEEEMKKDKYIIESDENPGEHSQAAMVIMDHTTGQVVACGGQLGEKTTNGDLNRATQIRKQVGSAMKPLSVIAPAVNEGIINAASVYKDEPTSFYGGTYTPKNYYGSYMGYQTVREAISISGNIIPLKILEQLGVSKSIEYLRNMGMTTISDTEGLSIGLGGLENGAYPVEVAAAYATIANDGTYIEPTFYKEVRNKDDEVILKPNQVTREVLDKSNAYIVKSIVTAPVVMSGGTATYCSIDGMDVAAKTGTTDSDYDRWLCGFTPYYTGVVWFGFDQNEEVHYYGSPSNPAGGIWSSVMDTIHEGLEPKRFEQPSNIITATVCKDSGLLPSDNCSQTITDIFVKGRVPKEKCGKNSRLYQICTDSGLLAIPGQCPNIEEKSFVDNEKDIPTQMCNIHKKEEVKPTTKPTTTPSPSPSTEPSPSPSPEPSTEPSPSPSTEPTPSPSSSPSPSPDSGDDNT
ncbi:MAG: transglycosylase domain-containing protein [Clostridia bacterium]|nr:transglycosylase domain-containing protein [Clostridia bacterium]